MKAVKEIERKYYKYQYGDWTQPVLTSDGVVGGSNFAVSSNVSQYTGAGVWGAFDGVTSGGTYFHSLQGVTTGYIDIYNPNPLKVSLITIYNQNAVVSQNRASSAGKIYGSNDGVNWVQLTTYTNTVQTIGGVWTIDLSSNNSHYNYYRMESTAGGSGGYWTINEIKLTAQQKVAFKSTEEDYDFYKDVDVYKLPKRTNTKHFKTIFEQATAGEYSVTLLPNTLYKLDIVGAGGGTYGSKVDYGNGGWTAVVRSGGSGGLISTYFYIPNDTDTTFTVTIGLGGVVGNGIKGGNSTFALDDLNLLVAEGGNGGSTATDNAIGGITSITTEFENDYRIKQTQNNGNVGGIYRELHVKGSAYYSSDWCVANLPGGLSLIDDTQYGYGAGAGCVNVTPYNGIDGYCRIMQETTAKDSQSSETVHIYYGII